jgi:hypothetical protein
MRGPFAACLAAGIALLTLKEIPGEFCPAFATFFA